MSRLSIAEKQRFSLLLLDPGEYYFYDFSANFHPESDSSNTESSMRKKIRGRLKVCSKSLVFDPTDISEPIMKIPFKNTISIDGLSNLLSSQELLVITCERIVQMMEENIIAPFIWKSGYRECKFSLNFAQIESFLPKLQNLLKISRGSPSQMERELQRNVLELRSTVNFDHSWIVDLHERKLHEAYATRLTPLVSNPGRIVVTNLRIYFQPYNNVDPEPVYKFKLNEITRIVKRRYMLRQVALEIFLKGNSTLLFSFEDQVTREQFIDFLNQQSELSSIEKDSTENYTLKWQNGLISNYEYLSYLNSIADRTVNDLTQYPVFPWTISDYKSISLDLNNPKTYRDLSKPIGALEPERLKAFKKRFKEMPEPKFLYGTHYSTPGYVLYYLVRIAPQYMLCLQNGKFDNPDRLFDSISETWESVLANHSDVKELIPEFYQLPEEEAPCFLLNSLNLDLGIKQNMKKVHDVTLPPWAKDHRDFLEKNIQALESDYVSSHLNEWIDLIFGYKQRGEEAVKADNVFYYLTYEGAVNIESIADPAERSSIEMQINEFGQTPKQLFKIPHPKRFNKNTDGIPQSISNSIDQFDRASCWKNINQISKDFSCKLHKEAVTSLCLSHNGETLYSVSQDSSLKIYSLTEKKTIRSINISDLALSSCSLSPDEKSIYIGSWDNSVYVYSVEYGKITEKINGHDDAISALKLQDSTLVTASWDSTIKVWDSTTSSGDSRRSKMIGEFSEHQSSVTSIDLSSDGRVIVSGGSEGSIMVWDLDAVGDGCIQNIEGHSDSVNCVSFFPDGQRIATCGKDGFLKIYQIGGGEVFSCETQSPLRCLLTDGQFLVGGDEKGNIIIWDIVTGNQEMKIPGHKGAVTCLAKSGDGSIIVSGGEDQCVNIWTIPKV